MQDARSRHPYPSLTNLDPFIHSTIDLILDYLKFSARIRRLLQEEVTIFSDWISEACERFYAEKFKVAR